jgi:hypothetical protein
VIDPVRARANELFLEAGRPAIRRLTPHTLRRTFASILAEALERLLGARLDEVGQILCGRQPEAEWSPIGHPGLESTRQRSSTIKLEEPGNATSRQTARASSGLEPETPSLPWKSTLSTRALAGPRQTTSCPHTGLYVMPSTRHSRPRNCRLAFAWCSWRARMIGPRSGRDEAHGPAPHEHAAGAALSGGYRAGADVAG